MKYFREDLIVICSLDQKGENQKEVYQLEDQLMIDFKKVKLLEM